METTLWEKEKILITTIFSFSANVSRRFLSHGCHNKETVLERATDLFYLDLNSYCLEIC